MKLEETFYELIKQMNLSFDEDEKDKDIKKIKEWVSSRFNKVFLAEVCAELERKKYINSDEKNEDNFLFMNDIYISPEFFVFKNVDASKEYNYITIQSSKAVYVTENGMKIELDNSSKVAACLDQLLQEDKEIYTYNEIYYMDIRKLVRNDKNELVYTDGSEEVAEKRFDELNTLLKKIYIKEKAKEKRNVNAEVYEEIGNFLADAIPVFDNDRNLKKIEEYAKQRRRIRKRMQRLYYEKRKKRELIYSNEKFEVLYNFLPERETIEKKLLKLEKLEEEAVFFFKQQIIALVSQDIENIDRMLIYFYKEIVQTRWQKGILGNNEYDELIANFEKIDECYKEISDEDEYNEFRDMMSDRNELRKGFNMRLSNEDYMKCFDNAYRKIMN